MVQNSIKSEHLLVESLKKRGMKIAFAESLTGGLISERIVSVPGASSIFEYGFITYSDESKIKVLGVSSECIEQYGSVSSQCAHFMAYGAYKNSNADVAVAVTGFAGPSDGNEYEPVGTVYLGICISGNVFVEKRFFTGDRQLIRSKTADAVFEIIINSL